MESIKNPYQNNSQVKKMMTVFGVYIGLLTAMMLSMGNSIVLPIAAKEIGGMDIYPLAATLAGVVSVGAMPLFGYLSARHPHIRRMGFVLAFLGGVLCLTIRAFAPNMWWVLIPSLLLGIESGALFTFGYSMIRDCFDQKQAGLYLGLIGTVIASGNLVGPLLTGAIIDLTGNWRIVPALQAVLWLAAGLLIFLGARITKEEGKSIAYNPGKFDFFGAITIVILLGSLILALSLGKIAPIGSPTSNSFFVMGFVALITMIYTVRRKKDQAIIPITAFKNRNTLVLTAANFLGMFDAMSVNFFLPMYIIYALQKTPTQAAFTLTLYAFLALFMSPIYGRWIARTGTAKPVIFWFSGIWRLIITVLLVIFVKPGVNLYLIYAIVVFCGLYSSAGSVAASAGPQIMLKPEIRQQSNALVQLGQNFGSAIGIATYAALISVYGLEDGMTYGLIVAAVGAAALMLSALFMRKPDFDQSLSSTASSGAK